MTAGVGAPDPAAGLPARVRLPRRFSVYAVGPGELRIQSAAQNVSVSGPRNLGAFAALAADAPDGFDPGALLAGLDGEERAEWAQVLRGLLERGMLVDAEPAAPSPGGAAARHAPQRLFFSHFGPAAPGSTEAPRPSDDGEAAQRRLAAASVVVMGLGQAGSTLARALALAGVGRLRLADTAPVAEEDAWGGGFYDAAEIGRPRAEALCGRLARLDERVVLEAAPWRADAAGDPRPLVEGCSLAVLCPDEFHPQAYDAVNEGCLAAGIPWINRRVLGFEVTVGPLVVPGQSPCYRCFDLRLLGNLTDPAERRSLHAYLERGALRTGTLPVAHGVELLATECIKRLSGFRPPATVGHVVFLSSAGDDVRRRPLLRIPRCPACGRGPAAERPAIDPWAHA